MVSAHCLKHNLSLVLLKEIRTDSSRDLLFSSVFHLFFQPPATLPEINKLLKKKVKTPNLYIYIILSFYLATACPRFSKIELINQNIKQLWPHDYDNSKISQNMNDDDGVN